MGKIGILIHGRHISASCWEKLMMGNPPRKCGSLTRMALEILERGQENIGIIVFGSGASEKDGLKEAEFMKQYLLDHVDQLKEFPEIKFHPRFQTDNDKQQLLQLFENIHCETLSKNTREEVQNAAHIFLEKECSEIYQISCKSHLPRCIREREIALEAMELPFRQRWYGIADDMIFDGSEMGDLVIFEPPHRGGDPLLKAPVKTAVIGEFFKVRTEKRVRCLLKIQEVIEGMAEE